MGLLKIKTNCIERPLRKLFKLYARVVTRFPFVFISASLLVSAIFAGGICRFRFEYTSDSALFTPSDSQVRRDQRRLADLFPTNYDDYRPSRVYDPDDQRYLSAVLYSEDGGNVLRRSHIQEVLQFDAEILSVEVRFNGTDDYSYESICPTRASSCFRNPFVDYLSSLPPPEGQPPEGEVIGIPYPDLSDESGDTYDVRQYLGGLRSSGGLVNYSDYILIRYVVREGDDDTGNNIHLWETAVQEHFSKQAYQSIRVLIVTSYDSLRFRDFVDGVGLEYLVISLAMLVIAVATSLMLRDHVQGKPCLAVMGAVSASLSAVSGIGLLSFCGFKFNQVTIWMPLYVMSIGLHHVFILVSSWRCNNFSNDVDETVRETMEYAGVTVTMATLIETLIFTVVTISPYPIIRDVGLYVGVSLGFNFLHQLTLFCPSLVIAGRREAANRHSCTFLRVRPHDNPRNTACYDIACAGGREDHHTVTNHLGKVLFEKYFATLCQFLLLIVVAFIIYLLYVGGALYGVITANIGSDIRTDELPLMEGVPGAYSLANRRRIYDPSISLVFPEEVLYWDDVIEGELVSLVSLLESTYFIRDGKHTQCWFIDYYKFLNDSHGESTSELNFTETLRENFLDLPEYTRYKSDIIFDEDDGIRASRCIMVLESDQISEEGRMLDLLLDHMHDMASVTSPRIGTEVLLFGNQLFHFEQYTTTLSQMRYLIITAVACTVFVALLLVPNPISATALPAFMLSIMAGVVGYGTFWGIALTPTTLVVILLCVGLCVEFTAHMTYTFHFVNMTPISRLSWSLGIVGYPSLQVSLCLLAGACVFLVFPGYFLYRACAKIIILTILCGYAHTFFFVPTILMVLYRRDSEQMYTI